MMNVNPLLKTDSYKFSHPLQYPIGTSELTTYIESRGYGERKLANKDGVVFFGLQMFLKELANTTITKEMVYEAAAFVHKHIGSNIYRTDDWLYVVNKLNGKIPIEISAVSEGSYIPNHNIIVKVRSTDERLFWMTGFLETQLLRAVWYPTTVCTISNDIKKIIYKYLLETSDDPKGQINFKLHDFGARGVSSGESAGIGGCAHLANFMGSDTVEGISYANHYYKSDMAAFSIPAAEHSTITAWGKYGEVNAFRNMLDKFAKPGALVAVVSDSYDLFHAIDNLWGKELKSQVIKSDAVLIVRPDSGNPPEIVLESLQRLDKAFGHAKNNKGFKVLNHVKIIQGDGVNEESINHILLTAKNSGYSADNIAFGMGGALLQKMDRDTFKFAEKACLAKINGKYVHVYKDPVTDPGKKSKSGDLDLVKFGHGYQTIDRLEINNPANSAPSELIPVYRNGEILKEYTLNEIRERANHRIYDETK